MVENTSRRELLMGLAGLALAAPGGAARANPSEIARPQIIGETSRHAVRAGETLLDLARTYDLGFVEMRAANPGVDAWAPRDGTEIVIPAAHVLPRDTGRRIVVNLGDMRLYWFGPQPDLVRSWPIGIGREAHQTPLGVLRVVEKRERPTWRPTPGQRRDNPSLPAAIPPGPNNPLGEYALRIGWDGYAIHGTNKPDSIGRPLTRGCIRLYPEDIEALFDLVAVGDEVRITDEPLKLGWADGELYMEAHVAGDQIEPTIYGRPIEPRPIPGLEARLAYAAGAHLGRIDWTRVRSLERERTGIPARITV